MKTLQIYISRTSYFGESRGPVYNVFENKVLHRCLSRILSTEFRKAVLSFICNFVKTFILQAFFNKQHFYKQHQAEIGKTSSKS